MKMRGWDQLSFLKYLLIGAIGVLVVLSLVYSPACWPVFILQKDAANETFRGFSLNIVLFFVAAYALMMWFGYRLSEPFWRSIVSPLWVKYVASFYIGYTCFLGPLRLLSLIVPYQDTYIAAVLFFLLMFCILNHPAYRHPVPPDSYQKNVTVKPEWVLFGASLVLLFASSLLLQVGTAEFSFVGHGYNQYVYLLDEWRHSPPAHFPVILKHYDELLFHYFLTWPLPPEFPNILAWWLTLGLTKVSIFAFLFLLFQKWGVSWRMSLLASLYLFLGTTCLVPNKYYILFDASNLLYFTVHSGRMVGVAFVFLLVANVLSPGRGSRLPWMLFVLSGLGLSTTSVSNAFWVITVYLLMAVFVFYYDRTADSLSRRGFWGDPFGTRVCYAAVIASMIMYGLSFNGQIFYCLRAGALLIVLLFFIGRIVFRCKAAANSFSEQDALFNKYSFFQGFVLLGAIVFGLIFLGNMFADNGLTKYVSKTLGHYLGPVEIKALPAVRGEAIIPEGGGTWAIGDHRELGGYNQYNQSLSLFVNYYGVILAMILTTSYLFRKWRQQSKQEFLLGELVLYELLLTMVAAMPCLLFFVDFVNFGSRGWLKSRFLEIPVYFIIFVFFYFFNKACSVKQKIVFGAILIGYIVIPFLGTQRPEQIAHNYKIFLKPVLPQNE